MKNFVLRILEFTALVNGLVSGVVESYRNQPQILFEKGNFIIESAFERNITISLRGRSKFLINDLDVLEAIEEAKAIADILHTNRDAPLEIQIEDARIKITGAGGFEERVQRIQNKTRNALGSGLRLRRLQQRVSRSEIRLRLLQRKLKMDDCVSAPCKNGAICIDLFNNFRCICPKAWTGTNCDVDVNECSIYEGSDLGCQNGADCVNTQGSYYCVCKNGWNGLHCLQRKLDCSKVPRAEICGHGDCVPVPSDEGYKCLCDQGWKTDGIAPACTVDVNECVESIGSTLRHCVGECINLPGSFECGPCPAGFTGNGASCEDIDECAIENGGCSSQPKVLCVNTQGSYSCGFCPRGWTGDGITCTRSNSTGCAGSNICSSIATCRIISDTPVCTCPSGTAGTGIGPNGCLPTILNPCYPNPCKNGGVCSINGTSHSCSCLQGYSQPSCDSSLNSCSRNPCRNGGICIPNNSQYTCQCIEGFGGRFCEQNQRACGGLLVSETGSLRYPPQGNATYKHNQRCAWVIRTHPDKVLNITFLEFELEPSSNCIYDWLQMHEGHSSVGQMVGRFCGIEKPRGGNIISTQNEMYFWFRSDGTTSHVGFSLTWNSIEPLCGGIIRKEEYGTLTSPGYPGFSPTNRHCVWDLSTDFGKRFHVSFYGINMGNAPNCTGDYLAFYDGHQETGLLLERFCTSSAPVPLFSLSHEMLIVFNTDSLDSDSSFQIHYQAENSIYGCGGVFTTPTGEFSSPMENGNYPNSVICEYVIEISGEVRINLEFTAFVLEETTNTDMVEIYEGKDEKKTFVVSYHGREIPENYTSLSNTVLIVFKTDASLSYTGFKLRYEIYCGGTFRGSGGIITSPNYPKSYLENRNCLYAIEAPPNYYIELQFLDFDLEAYTGCWADYVEIHDGFLKATTEPDIVTRYCSRTPETFVSTTNQIYVLFVTDSSQEGRGFKANYTFIEGLCGGVYKNTTGVISIPNGNDEFRYVHNISCTWAISAPEKHNILLTFSRFDIVESEGCSKNFLEISYQTEVGNGVDSSRFCGKNQPLGLTYNTNLLTIRFKTDSDINSEGFEMSYQMNDALKRCGGTFYSQYGAIQSPGWPNDYTKSITCEWFIRAANGNQIELVVNKFEIETSDECKFDYLEIRNGRDDTSPLIGRFCGTTIPQRIPSFTHDIYIRFVSDNSHTYPGFSIEWDATSTGCGGVMDAIRGSIVSPHYPEIIKDVAQCEWKVKVNIGSTMNITKMFIGEENCDRSSLFVYDGPNAASKILYKSCGQQEIRNSRIGNARFISGIFTTSNFAAIRFITDVQDTASGFMLSYNMNCHTTLTEPNGIIESPNFPQTYPNNMNCKWLILGRPNGQINISFSHFDLEMYTQDRCFANDYLSIRDYKGSDIIREEFHCMQKPMDHSAKVDSIEVVFVSDRNLGGTGFRLEYRIDMCGDKLTTPFGRFSSPNYPNDKYPINAYCEWTIEADHGTIIQVTIDVMHFELDSNDCKANEFSIITPGDDTDPLMKICENTDDSQHIVSSVTNKLKIVFRTDEIRKRKYFSARYQFIDSVCGGIHKSLEGFIMSPGYPSINYPSNANCIYEIRTDSFHTLELSLIDFELENSTECQKDSVKIYKDSMETVDQPFETLCGSQPSRRIPDIETDTSKILVHFKSDNATEKPGFKMYYKRNCGKLIQADFAGTIRKDMNSDNCIWTIKTNSTGFHITIVFSHIQCDCEGLPSDESCASSRGVAVYDGDSVRSPLKTQFCTHHPSNIVSNGQSLTVFGRTGSFEAIYTVYDNACGGRLRSLAGKFASPLFPNSYPVNVECIWTITARRGNFIELNFERFELEESLDCNDDYLEIREGSQHGKILGVFCSTKLPERIVAFETIWIKFRSDDDSVASGFEAEYSYAHDNFLEGPQGIIESPPLRAISSDQLGYSWRISVDLSNTTMIIFREYTDGLKAYDGYDETAREIEINSNTKEISATTSMIFLKLDSHNFEPFRVEWKSIPKYSSLMNNTNITECGDHQIIVVTPQKYTSLMSPNYPKDYPIDIECEWILKTNDSSTHVLASEIRLDLEETESCNADYIEISTSHNLVDWKLDRRICRTENYFMLRSYEGTPYLKVLFHSDITITKTGFWLRLTVACGNNMTGPTGIIGGYTTLSQFDQSNCYWTVTVRPGRKIKFNFENLQKPTINNHGQCPNYLTIRDGLHEDAQYLGIGQYCVNQENTIPLTTSHRAFIKFRIDEYHTLDWALRYTEVNDNDCGGDIILRDGVDSTVTIQTPNYPEIPSPHTECRWIISAPAGERINVEFIERFDLRFTVGCTEEYIQAFDGATELAASIGIWCRNPKQIRSTGNLISLKYFTDTPDPRNGFKAVASIANCGGQYLSNRGQIKSPHYPIAGAYPRNTICEYRIKALSNYGLNITLVDLDLPFNSSSDINDELAIFAIFQSGTDNSTFEKYELNRFYGNSTTKYLSSYSNEVLIQFKTTDKINMQYRGFKLIYNVNAQKCGNTLTTEVGELSTPNYPRGVTVPVACTWKISVPKGRRITLEIDAITRNLPNVEDSTTRLPMTAFTFYNDFTFRAPIRTLMLNTDTVQYINSTDNKMMVRVFLRPNTTVQAAKMKYNSDELSLCTGDISGLAGEIGGGLPQLLPAYLCEYEANLDLNQTISFEIDYMIHSYFLGQSCYSNPPIAFYRNQWQKFETVCENATRKITSFPFQNLKLQIVKIPSSAIQSVHMKYKRYDCGGVFRMSNVIEITNPKRATEDLAGIDCAWSITNSYKRFVLAGNFSLQLNCDKEYVDIFHGNTPLSPHIGRYCETSELQNFTGNYNFFVQYHSDGKALESQFTITARVEEQCGGDFMFPYITSIDLRKAEYKNNQECIWTVTARDNQHVGIVPTGRFFIENSPNCMKDYLEVFDFVENDWISLGKVCGRQTPPMFNSTGHKAMILFRSDNATTGDGFSLKLYENCGGIYMASNTHQTISSPKMRNQKGYLPNSFCNYTLMAPADKAISVKFNYFNLEKSRQCSFDNLTIYRKKESYRDSEMEALGPYCLENSLDEVRGRERMELIFKTDNSISLGGFSCDYFLDECGGIVTQSTVIKTPKDIDGNFPLNENCVWNITAPAGQMIVIRFEYLEMESLYECAYEFVDIYSGHTAKDDNRVIRVCGNLTGKLPDIKINDRFAIIQATSDSSSSERGFSALIFMLPTCDEKIIFRENNLTYVLDMYSSGYVSSVDCHYQFIAPDGYQLRIQFSTLELVRCGNHSASKCNCDYVEIRDGGGTHSSLMGQFCDVKPASLVSTTSQLYLRFVTDSQLTGRGFNATITAERSLCGPSTLNITKGIPLIITSPGWPENYYPNLKCIWLLESKHAVDITFEAFDLPASKDDDACLDYLQISDQQNDKAFLSDWNSDTIIRGQNTPYFSGTSIGKQKFCGNKIPPNLNTYYETMLLLTFSSDIQNQRKGFKLVVQAQDDCSQTSSRSSGWIVFLFRMESECNYSIFAQENYTISLHIERLHFFSECEVEYVKIYSNSSKQLENTICGSSDVRHLFLDTNVARVNFKKQSVYSTFIGFYVTTNAGLGCGGDIYDYMGFFASPTYPLNDRNSTICIWNIHGSYGSKSVIIFPVFDMGSKVTCSSDYVQILEPTGGLGLLEVKRQYCGEDNPSTYITSGHQVSIKYVKTQNFDGTGWLLKFRAVADDEQALAIQRQYEIYGD